MISSRVLILSVIPFALHVPTRDWWSWSAIGTPFASENSVAAFVKTVSTATGNAHISVSTKEIGTENVS